MSRWIVLLAAFALSSCTSESTSSSPIEPTPTAFYEGMQSTVVNNEPEKMWRTLPTSYQAEVTNLLDEASTTIDPDLYSQAMGVVAKLANLLEAKQELFVTMQQEQDPTATEADLAETRKSMTEASKMLKKVSTGDMKTLDGLEGLNVESFLADLDADLSGLMKVNDDMPIESIREATFTVVDQGDGEATIKIEAPGEEPETAVVVKVDDMWLPKSMIENWKTTMAEAKTGLARFSKDSKDLPKMKQTLTMIDGLLDQLAAAESKEQLQMMVMGMMFQIAPIMEQFGQ